MRKPLVPRTKVLIMILVVVGLGSPWTQVSSRVDADEPILPEAPSPDDRIKITFRGLMAFGMVQEPGQTGHRVVVNLHSGKHHHYLRILIKGPMFDDFLDWGHRYKKNADMKLIVDNSADSAEWDERKPKPYRIADLHLSAGELKFRHNFKPTFTINAGTFGGYDYQRPIDFFLEGHEGERDPENNVPRQIVCTIDLSGKTATLSGNDLKTIHMNSGPWEILVTNNPDIGSVCDEYHFVYYYDGFVLRRAGRPDMDVRDTERYRARSGSGVDPCTQRPVLYERAIETRPCIPVGY